MAKKTNEQEKWALELIKALQDERFFGKIEIKLRDGKIVNMTKEQSITLPDFSRN